MSSPPPLPTTATPSSIRVPVAPHALVGIAAAPGVAVAPALVIEPRQVTFVRRLIRGHDADIEIDRFRVAVARAQEELRTMSEATAGSLARSEMNILEAYVLMLGDELLADAVERHIRINRQCVEWAVSSAIHEFSSSLAAAQDAYLRERSRDCEFVGERLLLALSGSSPQRGPELTEPAILVAQELSPADLLSLGTSGLLLGLLTESGTRTSHTAILARAMEVPAVLGVPDLLLQVVSGDTLILDGLRGTVIVRPTTEMAIRGRARGERHQAMARTLRGDVHRPARLACGQDVCLQANIELSSEAVYAMRHGAEGIGLYRTEYLYLDRGDVPSEDEQFEHYRTVVREMEGRPVTFRTFDLGSDKMDANLTLSFEPNPALGSRAVRLALRRPEVFRTQLRAMVRASAEGSVRVMVPMVSSLREWNEVKQLMAQAIQEVDEVGHPRADRLELGLMVEVPSVAIMADLFARQSDFLSLGTNDLVQYTLAVDRTVPHLAHLASPFDPAVLRLLRGVIAAAAQCNKPLSVCGAMAADPLAAILLVGLGLRGLSMEPTAIPEIKEALRRVSLDEACRSAAQALSLPSGADVENVLAVAYAPRLFDLLSGDDESVDLRPSRSDHEPQPRVEVVVR